MEAYLLYLKPKVKDNPILELINGGIPTSVGIFPGLFPFSSPGTFGLL
jgi:hypothetical protein